MRTGRSLTVCRSLLPGGCVLPFGGASQGCVCFPGGACFLGERVLPGGCVLPRGVCASWVCVLPRGVCFWGVCASWGVVSQHALRQTPPPVYRITDTSKNITLAPTSLRPVNIWWILVIFPCENSMMHLEPHVQLQHGIKACSHERSWLSQWMGCTGYKCQCEQPFVMISLCILITIVDACCSNGQWVNLWLITQRWEYHSSLFHTFYLGLRKVFRPETVPILRGSAEASWTM